MCRNLSWHGWYCILAKFDNYEVIKFVTDGDAVYYWKKRIVTAVSVNAYATRESGIVCVYTNNIVSFFDNVKVKTSLAMRTS